MKPPFLREQSNRMTRHHLLFERPQWSAPKPNQVRTLGSYVVGIHRYGHDYLHQVIKPVPVPGNKVLDAMYELGKDYIGWQNDQNRMDRILDGLVGYARSTHSPHECHDMLQVATSIEAQMSVLNFLKGVRPRYE